MNLKKMSAIGSAFLVLCVIALNTPIYSVHAASLTALSDTLSSAKINTLSNHDIVFTTPTGIAAGATVILTFPGSFSIAAALDFTDIDVLDNAANVTLAAAPSGATWGAVRTSGTVITLTNGSSAVTAGHTVRIKIGTNATNQSTGVRQITNDTTTGTKAIAVTGTFGDTGTISVQLITDDTVVVSGTVSQAITFSISSNTISFGTLDAGNARYANTTTGSASDVVAHTLAVSTNAATGYTVTVQGATLTSQQNSANTITAIGASPAVSSAGSEQFGIYATKSGGVNGTIGTPFATGSSFGYNGTASTAVTFASGTTATAAETYSLHYLANIAPTTEAGTYNASLVYVATANF
ncbi:MAG: hypothetical protein JWL80_244 [Parcubacteria group bacterium]|nr:hypothetical protein [Parcubacteria group bacterium]